MEDVISYSEPNVSKPVRPISLKKRFQTTTAELNSLAMTRLFDMDPDNNAQKVNANGTWDSIVAFGKISGLDNEQQTAYEILAATYVLTFCDEAQDNLTGHGRIEEFEKQKEELLKLARRSNRQPAGADEPLRMFVTGPAGAGKCKLLWFKMHCEITFTW